METVNGEWYLKGCSPEDPARLRSVEEAAELIRRIGFLPLFSNEIPGFSVEERTSSRDWWSDDPQRDPWLWRQILARRPDILYGKFFDRKAGFVSAECFPFFANHRRDGYDFDARADEGLVPHRASKMMRPYLTGGIPNDTALFSFVLKAQTGFGPDGEKNFEGILTDLQMQTYLIIADFRQRLNRRGQPYGWHLAVIQTPEAKLGYEAVTSAYSEQPQRSRERIKERVLRFFPETTGTQLQKWVGIGETPIRKER